MEGPGLHSQELQHYQLLPQPSPVECIDQALDRGWAEGKTSLAIARGGRLGAMQVGHEPLGSMLMSVTIEDCYHVHPCVRNVVFSPSTVIQDVDVKYVTTGSAGSLTVVTTSRTAPYHGVAHYCKCWGVGMCSSCSHALEHSCAVLFELRNNAELHQHGNVQLLFNAKVGRLGCQSARPLTVRNSFIYLISQPQQGPAAASLLIA
jgi:ferredoxin